MSFTPASADLVAQARGRFEELKAIAPGMRQESLLFILAQRNAYREDVECATWLRAVMEVGMQLDREYIADLKAGRKTVLGEEGAA